MATTRSSDVADQTPEIWSLDLFAEAEDQTFFQNWEGEPGSGMPIIRDDDLTKEAGNTIHTDIVLALDGDPIAGDTQALEGNEDEMKFRQNNFTLEYYKKGVRWTEKSDDQITHSMRKTARGQLAKWLAGYLDNRVFTIMSGNGSATIPTAAKWAAGTATSRNTVADTDAGGKLTWNTLMELRAYARSELKIEPILTAEGEEMFILVAHPYALMELKRDDTKWSQAQRDAQIRGDTNPVFTGSAGMVDGIILKESNRTRRSLNVGSPIMVADNILLGANAMTRGYGKYPDWRERDFDYGTESGVATVFAVGENLTIFDTTDAGGAADAAKTWIGGMVVYSAAVTPGQP